MSANPINPTSSNEIVLLTEASSAQISRLMAKENKSGSALRVSVVGGGCSGLSYKMSFEETPTTTDTVSEQFGFKVLIDPKSALFLKGITIDYVDGLNGAGFTFQNPNAKRSCGCGTSFSA